MGFYINIQRLANKLALMHVMKTCQPSAAPASTSRQHSKSGVARCLDSTWIWKLKKRDLMSQYKHKGTGAVLA